MGRTTNERDGEEDRKGEGRDRCRMGEKESNAWGDCGNKRDGRDVWDAHSAVLSLSSASACWRRQARMDWDGRMRTWIEEEEGGSVWIQVQ